MSEFLHEHLLSTLTFLSTLIFMTAAVRSRRPAGSTMAWLLVIFVAPYVGIPLYILLSGRKLPTRLAQKQDLYRREVNAPPHDEPSSGLQKILRSFGVPPVRKNEFNDLLINGEVAYDRYLELIQSAKKSIRVTTFIFGKDSVGESLVRALAKRAAEGIDVRVIVDSFGAVVLRHPSLLDFKKSNGKLAYFMPLFHLPFRGSDKFEESPKAPHHRWSRRHRRGDESRERVHGPLSRAIAVGRSRSARSWRLRLRSRTSF